MRRQRAACYNVPPDSIKVGAFLVAIAKAASYGIRFVIRDHMTQLWFDNELSHEPEEVKQRVHKLMGPKALPDTMKWGRAGDPTLIRFAGPGSDLVTE